MGEPRSDWMDFLAWEAEAARQGSGMTDDQKTGAAMFRSWLVNHAPDPALADCHICHRPLTDDDWRTFDDNGRIYAVCGVCISQGDEG